MTTNSKGAVKKASIKYSDGCRRSGMLLISTIILLMAIAPGMALGYTGATLTGGSGIADLQTADVLSTGNVTIGLSWEKSKYMLKVDPEDMMVRLSVTAGLFKNMEMFASAPYREFECEGEESGPGDAFAGLKYRFSGKDAPLGLAAYAAIHLPTGDEDKGLGTGRTDPVAGLAATRYFGRLAAAFDVSLLLREDRDDILQYGLGLMFPMDWPVKFFIEYFGTSGFNDAFGFDDAKVGGGVRWDISPRWQITAGGSGGIYGDGPVSPDWRFFAGVNFYFGGIPKTVVRGALPPSAPGSGMAPGAAPGMGSAPGAAPGMGAGMAPGAAPGTGSAPGSIGPGGPSSPAGAGAGMAPGGAPGMGSAPGAQPGAGLPFEDVYFDFDHMLLTAEGESRLKSVAKYLRENPEARIVVEGNCDSTGTASYNLGLGQRRAKSVGYYLIFYQGVSPDRVEFKSWGEMKPAATNKTEKGRSENRRGHLVIIP